MGPKYFTAVTHTAGIKNCSPISKTEEQTKESNNTYTPQKKNSPFAGLQMNFLFIATYNTG